MKVVSVINYKGGVGKTTVTSNLAAYVASKGKRVLMIDVDPQTNLTFSFIDSLEWANKYGSNRTLKNFFQSIIDTGKKTISFEDLIIPLDLAGVKLDIISSHLDLINIDIKLAAGLAAPSLQLLATKYLEVHNYFRQEIDKLKDTYDLILIDCAPNFNLVTKNALVASDNYLAPSKMDYLSTFGVTQLTRNVNDFIKEYNNYTKATKDALAHPELLGIVATMVGIRDGEFVAANKYYYENLKTQGYKTFESFIREYKSLFAEAPSSNIPLVLSKVHAEVIEELQKLGEEFMKEAKI